MRWSTPAWATGERGRFARASAVGAILAVLCFAWLGSRGRLDLTEWQLSGDFYDAQAESWLDGTWQIDGGTLGIERFEARGGSYMYQGPWPALLRVPVVAVTDELHGRLSLLSMLLGIGVATAAASRLHWQVRRLVRGAAPLSRADVWLAALTPLVVGAGSALFYEGSRPWVYHEASVWGVAWAIASLDAALRCVTNPSRRRFAWAAVTTTLALTSRSSVGLAGVTALAILCGGNAVARLRHARPSGSRLARLVQPLWSLGGAPTAAGRLPVLAPGLAATVPLAVYAAINWIKFRTLFSIPFVAQGMTIIDPKRQAFLDANDGTLFGLKFLPTTLVHYLRPDAISLTRTFPFVDFPPKATLVGHVQFDLVDYSSSVPSTMPALTILAILGALVMFRRSDHRPGVGWAALRGPTLGALAGALTMLPFGYIANRYLADALPVLLIAGLAGTHALMGRSTATSVTRRRLPWIGLGALAIAGAWINLSHALIFQRLYSPNVKDDLVAAFIDTRFDVGQQVGLDPPIPIMEVDELPLDVPRGRIAIVGDCKAMYLSDGLDLNAVKFTPWNPAERGEAGGRYLRTIDFPLNDPGTRLPLFSMHSSAGDGQLYAEWQGGAGVRFVYDGPGGEFPSRTWYLPPGEAHTLDLVADPRIDVVQVYLGDKRYYENRYLAPEDATIDIGVDTLVDPILEDTYTGRLEPLPERVGVCEELRREAANR